MCLYAQCLIPKVNWPETLYHLIRIQFPSTDDNMYFIYYICNFISKQIKKSIMIDSLRHDYRLQHGLPFPLGLVFFKTIWFSSLLKSFSFMLRLWRCFIKIFMRALWNAISTLVESSADVSTKAMWLDSAKHFASSIWTALRSRLYILGWLY